MCFKVTAFDKDINVAGRSIADVFYNIDIKYKEKIYEIIVL